MTESTLTQVFGSGASQTATQLIINKADLAAVGLTASANNVAESLVAAIILLLRNNLSQSNFDSNIDQSIYVGEGFPTFAYRGADNTQYRVDQFNINFAKLDTGAVIDPDDY